MIRKRDSKKFVAIFALSLTINFLSPFQSRADQVTLKLGFQGPLTGPESLIGIEQSRAVTYAVTKFNQSHAGKVQVEIQLADDRGDGATAATVAPAMAQKTDIIGLVGPSYSGAARASIPSYRAQGISMISPSASNPVLTDPNSSSNGIGIFHRIAYSTDLEANISAKLLNIGIATPRIYVVSSDDPYSNSLALGLKKTGMGILGEKTFPSGTTNFASAVTEIKAQAINSVAYTGYYPEAVNFVNQLRASGYLGRIVLSDGSSSPLFINGVGNKNAEGVLLTSSFIPSSDLPADFKSDFKLVTGYEPSMYTANAFDATNVFLSCIDLGITTRNQMMNCVNTFKGTNIWGESIFFSSNGEIQGSRYPTIIIKNGEFKYLNLTDLMPAPVKPSKPTLNTISYKNGQVHVSVTLTDAQIPESAFLLIPSISTEKIMATIQGNVASWIFDVSDLMFGKLLNLSLVSVRNGLESETLEGTIDVPTKEAVMLDKVTMVPTLPRGIKASSTGSIEVISVQFDQSPTSMAVATYFYSPDLNISKAEAIEGSISGDRAFFNIPITSKMAGKKYKFSIFSTNKLGDGKELKSSFAIPVAKTISKLGIKCSKSSQVRTFSSKSCPPGWKKSS